MKTFAGRKLSRPTGHRNALLRNLASSLLLNEKIVTTFPKAKETARFAEKMITKAKRGGLANLRLIAKQLHQKEVRKKLVEVIAPRYQARNGGYTQIFKTLPRQGDAARMAVVRLLP